MTMPNPLGDPLAVSITGREIYDAVVRLTGRVDVLIEQQSAVREDVAEIRTDLHDKEQRIRALERSRWPLPAVSVLIALGALGASVIPRL